MDLSKMTRRDFHKSTTLGVTSLALSDAAAADAFFQETVFADVQRVTLSVVDGPEVLVMEAPQLRDSCPLGLPGASTASPRTSGTTIGLSTPTSSRQATTSTPRRSPTSTTRP